MTQKDFILQMLKESPEGVTCAEFEQARFGTFHKLSSLISDLRKLGYDIIRIESHDGEVMKERYKLVSEPSHKPSILIKKADSSPDTLFTLPDYDPCLDLMAEIDNFKTHGGCQ